MQKVNEILEHTKKYVEMMKDGFTDSKDVLNITDWIDQAISIIKLISSTHTCKYKYIGKYLSSYISEPDHNYRVTNCSACGLGMNIELAERLTFCPGCGRRVIFDDVVEDKEIEA